MFKEFLGGEGLLTYDSLGTKTYYWFGKEFNRVITFAKLGFKKDGDGLSLIHDRSEFNEID